MRARGPRLILLALIAFVLTLTRSGTAQATTTPGVNATPGNVTAHWWGSDGCTAVPDSGTYRGVSFDFNHACVHHDGCYAYHWGSRSTCDDWFYNDMVASCNYLHSASSSRLLCDEQAGIYWQGVRWFGGPFYTWWSYKTPLA